MTKPVPFTLRIADVEMPICATAWVVRAFPPILRPAML